MHTINMISALLASIFLTFMALFVLIKDWRNQINRYYVFYNIAALGILFTMFITYAFPHSAWLTQINRITQLFTVLFFASFFTMSLVFPRGEKRFPLYITLIVLLPAMAIAYLVTVTDWTITRAYFENDVLKRNFQDFYSFYAVITFLYLLAGTVNFIRKYFRTNVEIYRLQMKYLFVGSSTALIFAATCSIILPRLFEYSKLYAIGPSIASFIVTAALFYSVIAYQLMDMTTAIHRTAMYALLSILIFVPVYAVIAMYYRDIWIISKFPIYIIASVIVIIFILISVFIHPRVDRLFRRRQFEFENLANNFIRSIENVRDSSNAIENTVRVLYQGLNLKHSICYLYDEQKRRYDLFYKEGNTDIPVDYVDRSSPLIRWFVRNQEILHLDRIYTDDREFSDIRDEMLSFFTDNNVKVLMPIYHEKRVVGLFCLGEKSDYSPFSAAELDQLQDFLSECSDILSTTLAYQKASEEQFLNRTVDVSSYILDKSVPEKLPVAAGIRFGAFLFPKYQSGVDYFDFIPLGENGIGFIVTDIAGVGINSSLYSVLLRSSYQAQIQDVASTHGVTQMLNRVLYDYNSGRGGLVTSFCFYYDSKNMRLSYTNAGCPALELFRIEKNDFDTLDTEGIPLGYDSSAHYGTGRTNVARGDLGVVYSRALVNAKNQQGERFGLLRLRDIVKVNRSKKPAEIADILHEAYEKFMGLASGDADIIVLIFKIV
jgi:hypothetical protein